MRHLLLFLFSLLPTFLWADNISVEKAQELAITFFKEGHPQRSAFSSLRLLVTDEAVSARAVGEAPAYLCVWLYRQRGLRHCGGR